MRLFYSLLLTYLNISFIFRLMNFSPISIRTFGEAIILERPSCLDRAFGRIEPVPCPAAQVHDPCPSIARRIDARRLEDKVRPGVSNPERAYLFE